MSPIDRLLMWCLQQTRQCIVVEVCYHVLVPAVAELSSKSQTNIAIELVYLQMRTTTGRGYTLMS